MVDIAVSDWGSPVELCIHLLSLVGDQEKAIVQAALSSSQQPTTSVIEEEESECSEINPGDPNHNKSAEVPMSPECHRRSHDSHHERPETHRESLKRHHESHEPDDDFSRYSPKNPQSANSGNHGDSLRKRKRTISIASETGELQVPPLLQADCGSEDLGALRIPRQRSLTRVLRSVQPQSSSNRNFVMEWRQCLQASQPSPFVSKPVVPSSSPNPSLAREQSVYQSGGDRERPASRQRMIALQGRNPVSASTGDSYSLSHVFRQPSLSATSGQPVSYGSLQSSDLAGAIVMVDSFPATSDGAWTTWTTEPSAAAASIPISHQGYHRLKAVEPRIYHLTTQCRVPDTAKSIAFALKGDIDGLKYLFSRGLASPSDVSDSRGFSLIRVSFTPFSLSLSWNNAESLVGALWRNAPV